VAYTTFCFLQNRRICTPWFHPRRHGYFCASCVSADICASGRRNVEFLRGTAGLWPVCC